MPLSEADFYAYSRATGTPVPRDAQERAEIAPQVLGFRQGQLSDTKEELDRGNFIDMAGKTALVAGLGAGAAALATGGRFGKLRDALANVVRPKDKGATTGVRTVDLNKTNIPVEEVYVQDVTPSAPGTRTAPRARTTDIPIQKVYVQDVTPSAPTAKTGSFGDIYQDLSSTIEVSPSTLALPEETAVGRKQRIIQEVLRRNPRGAGTSADAQFTPKGVDVDISARTGREEPLPEYLARARETSPERFKELDILQGNMDMADLFYRTKGTGKDVPALPAAMTPRSYVESTGAVAPSSSSPASRRARNQQKDLDRIRSSMSDVVDSVMDEDYFNTEPPSSLLNLANKIQNPDIPLTTETVEEFKNWAQKTFANDPTVLSELNEDLSSLPLMRGATAPAPSSSTLVEQQNARRPLVSEQSVEAVDTGADQVFGRVMEDVQRNEDLSISSAATYLNNRRDEIASMLGEQGLTVTPGRIEEALGYEFGPKAYTFGPKQTQRKQSLQLGATYNTNFFENLKTPSVQVAGKTIPTSSLKQPTVMEATAKRLEERVNKAKTRIGDVALEQQMREVRFQQGQKQLGELGAYAQELKNFAQTTTDPLLADRAMGRRSDVLLEYDMLENRLNQSLGALEGGRRGEAKFRQKVGESISKMEPPARLKPGIEEGQRIFFEQDPTTLTPTFGTQKIVSERKMIDTETKGGGGRKVAEYTGGGSMGDSDIDLDAVISNVQTKQDYREYSPDQFASDYSYKQQFSDPADRRRWTGDRTQTGREIDQYGIRLSSERRADTSLKPSTPVYTRAEIADATEKLTKIGPKTGKKIRPERAAVIQSMGYQPKTPEGRDAIDVSRRLTALQRQANQGNPRAQAELKALESQANLDSFIQNMRG
jgi:hypothetical protein